MDNLLVHKCTIKNRYRKQRLDYQDGTATFNAGDQITGTTSGATAKVDELIPSRGSWTNGDAEGYMVLSNVVGAFQDGEIVTSPSGSATTSAPSFDYETNGGEYLFYHDPAGVEVNCRFVTVTRSVWQGESGRMVKKTIKLFLGPDSVIQEDDHVVTDTPGYKGTYRVKSAPPVYSTVAHHIEAELEALP